MASRPCGSLRSMSTARLRQTLTLGHRPNLGDETTDVELAEGDEVEVMQRFDDRALVKDPEGRLFTVALDVLDLPTDDDEG